MVITIGVSYENVTCMSLIQMHLAPCTNQTCNCLFYFVLAYDITIQLILLNPNLINLAIRLSLGGYQVMTMLSPPGNHLVTTLLPDQLYHLVHNYCTITMCNALKGIVLGLPSLHNILLEV